MEGIGNLAERLLVVVRAAAGMEMRVMHPQSYCPVPGRKVRIAAMTWVKTEN
jgi:hypothetical protein